MGVYECLWVFMSVMGVYQCLWISMDVYGYLWVPMGAMGIHGCLRCLWISQVPMSIYWCHGCLWVLYLKILPIFSFKNPRRFETPQKTSEITHVMGNSVCTTGERDFIDSCVFSTRLWYCSAFACDSY